MTGYLPVKEAAGELGVSESTLRRWIRTGRVPYKVTPGGKRRVRVEDCLLDPEHGHSHDRRSVRKPVVHELDRLMAQLREAS